MEIINKKIIESVNRGIQLALDDFEDIDNISSNKNDIVSSSNFDEYVKFRNIIKKILNHDRDLPRKLDEIRVYKEMIKLHDDYGFLYKVNTLDELKSIIERFIDIWPVATNNFNWLDVSSLTSLQYAFSSASIRDKIGKVIIDEWNVSNVKDIQFMAWQCAYFEADLSKWNVSNLEYAGGAFLGCKKFNSDLSNWNVSNLYEASSMFLYCDNFNSDLSRWNVSNLVGASQMFKECKSFNSDLSKWDVSNVQNANMMFWDCEAFNQDLSKWDLAKCNNGNRDQWFRQVFEYTPMEHEYDLYPDKLLTDNMRIQATMKKK